MVLPSFWNSFPHFVVHPISKPWRTSIDMMRRKYEYIMWKHGCYLIRCGTYIQVLFLLTLDFPAPGGMGTSQIIGPDGTYYPKHVISLLILLLISVRGFTQPIPFLYPSNARLFSIVLLYQTKIELLLRIMLVHYSTRFGMQRLISGQRFLLSRRELSDSLCCAVGKYSFELNE